MKNTRKIQFFKTFYKTTKQFVLNTANNNNSKWFTHKTNKYKKVLDKDVQCQFYLIIWQ
jgi:hypothetical protein